MTLLLRLAIRNVLRQKVRTLLTALSLFFASYIVALAFGWAGGAISAYMDNFSVYQTGHLRITSQDYLSRERFMPVDALISDIEPLRQTLLKEPHIASIEERIRFGLLLGHQNYTQQSMGFGIDLFNTKLKVKEKLVEGSLSLSGIAIGEGLAKKLHIQLGDNLLLATRTSEGGLNGIKLPVTGIFQLKNKLFDNNAFFISLEQARKLLKFGAYGTELYVYTDSPELSNQIQSSLSPLLPNDLSIETLEEQLGSLYQWLKLGSTIMYFFVCLILFLASFVVINTMMMCIFERIREIGTLRALGMKKRALFTQLIIEGALIAAIGCIPGAILGYLTCLAMSINGIDYGKEMENIDMPIEYIIRPEISLEMVLITIIIGIIITAFTTIYPAYYASKLPPSEALKKT